MEKGELRYPTFPGRPWRQPIMRPSTLLLLCVVGLSQADREKIFNGVECVKNSQPWQVGLFRGKYLRCGGVLVDRQWILTAAHCSGKYVVRLGEHSLTKLDWTEQLRLTTFSMTHPSYQGAHQNHEHDLRLLRLSRPVHLTHAVRPLALPAFCAPMGTKCHISGWGITNKPWDPFPDRLQCLDLSIVSNNTCQAVFPGRVTENMVCAGGEAGKDACQGDSGGPLVCGGVLQGEPGARPALLQAMVILRFITLALVTGLVGGETRIIKGYECTPHSQPWQVALFQKTRLLCGATLIAPKWLLTAAHCRKPRYVILLGEHNLEKTDGYEQKRMATESFPHPGFNNSLPNKDHRNDIMLVKMSSPAILTRAVQPLTLSSHCVTAGTSCLISGWGTTSSPQLRLPHSLRCANVSIIEHKECENAYPGNITETMLCASVRKEGKDSCQGDSGGPLVCNGSLQGIISWGQDPCAVTRKPGVYTKVCKYTDWIYEIMKNN
ncbi:kallikrein-11-like protein [Cricetulus griseus]|nr:kallikrein-11-like protein [Cricetulus griseus]